MSVILCCKQLQTMCQMSSLNEQLLNEQLLNEQSLNEQSFNRLLLYCIIMLINFKKKQLERSCQKIL